MIKRISLSLFLIPTLSFAQNTIIAIVNDDFISSNHIKTKLFEMSSYNVKVELLNKQIDNILQLQKANELNLKPSEIEINKSLLKIAKNNSLTIDELLNFDEIISIKKGISEQLLILSLQRNITKDIEASKKQILEKCTNINSDDNLKQIKIAQIIISEIDTNIKDTAQKNELIKSFLNKLSKLISNGASFEAFAKLHSQHPSYKDGGITDWLTVDNPTLEILDSLNNNEVSRIYLTDFGFAIAIKIDERFISSKLKTCEEQIIYKNSEKYYAEWLKNLREEAYIEIYYDKLY